MSTTEPSGTQTVQSPRSRPKRAWELIALVAVVAVLIVGEVSFQWAKHRGWTTYTKDDGLTGYALGSPVEAPDGAVWLDMWGSGVSIGAYRFDGEGVTHYTEEDGLADDDVQHIAVAPDGAIWFATDGGVSRFDGETWSTYTEDDGLAINDVDTIFVAPDGALWFGTRGGGVSRFDPLAKGVAWTTYTEDDGLAGNYVSTIAVAPDGALWFGTGRYEEGEYLGDGVSRFDPLAKGEAWTTYTTADGLADDSVVDIVVGPDGALWFRTKRLRGSFVDGHVSRFDGETWTNPVIVGLSDYDVMSVAVASDGALWVRRRYGVSRFDGETWSSYGSRDGLAGGFVYGIAAAPDGVVWVGSVGGVSRFDGETWSPYTATNSGLAEGYVESLFADSQGRVWAGAGDGLSVFDANVGLSGRILRTWNSVRDGLQILGIIVLLALVQSWIVRRDREARRKMAPAAARPIRAKLPSIGLGVLGSLAGVVLFSIWGLPRLNEAMGAGMIMMLLIGPVLGVVCLVLGAVAGWVSARKPTSRWAALIGGLIVGFVAASVTFVLMMTAWV